MCFKLDLQQEDQNCLFCQRNNKSGYNCKNCKQKTKIKIIFKTWKRYVDEINSKVDFRKYMDILSYKHLCRKKCYEDCISFILSDRCWLVMQDIKDKIIKFQRN